MRDTEFFRHIKRIEVPWRDRSIFLPSFYYDAIAIEADFLASTEQVKSRLPYARMHPYRIAPGRCLVAILALAYRDSDVGPYKGVQDATPEGAVPSPRQTHFYTDKSRKGHELPGLARSPCKEMADRL